MWPEFATFWLYTAFMTGCSYTQILLYCLDIQSKNVNLVLFDKHAFAGFLKFIQSVPQMTQAVQDHFKLIIGQIKTQNIATYW